jgi:hypothetical protein
MARADTWSAIGILYPTRSSTRLGGSHRSSSRGCSGVRTLARYRSGPHGQRNQTEHDHRRKRGQQVPVLPGQSHIAPPSSRRLHLERNYARRQGTVGATRAPRWSYTHTVRPLQERGARRASLVTTRLDAASWQRPSARDEDCLAPYMTNARHVCLCHPLDAVRDRQPRPDVGCGV